MVTISSGVSETEFAQAGRGRGPDHRVLVEPDHAALAHIAGLIDASQLRPEVATVFPLEEAAKVGEQGHIQGKLVLSTLS